MNTDSLSESAAAMQNQITCLLKHVVPITWKAETSSTNDDAKQAALDNEPAPHIYGAERQTEGRGRIARKWLSGAGQSVEMSFLLRPEISSDFLAGISFAAALGICRGIERWGVKAQVKWPNDVMVAGAKICGILSEAGLQNGVASFVVVGTGINVNQVSFPEAVAKRAVSLRQLTGRPISRAQVAAACINGIIQYVGLLATQGMQSILSEYRSRSSVLGEIVEVHGNGIVYSGRCLDIDSDGALVMEESGSRRRFLANDVSLRSAGPNV